MTLIVFDSFTGNVKRFTEKVVEKTDLKAVQIKDGLIIKEPFVLFTYTTGFGKVSESTMKFLNRGNFMNLVGVASSGNMNWGVDLFARSGNLIADKYNVPLLHKFENEGMESDVKEVIHRMKELNIK
ncbi:class Ib ribonucleoside-diphosphate reductase assembly flavoprotein NrdI [Klebsiella pneumoniae]|nr:class Ib ribonucleoside-diphosphate reductase assembly flavoprotein NrdI [Klebsiella pneumoniae]MDS7714393.1 class Ib ribonucleoside-diphosphate reductase assembly flavoprotein NrdI [Klebsiella pneumoniae]